MIPMTMKYKLLSSAWSLHELRFQGSVRELYPFLPAWHRKPRRQTRVRVFNWL